ncbi:MAG: hypothetical protein HC915_00970 [Anaerolineae bacterium]|nr:hypothetical protein [Anaerolineae bacterium]
MPPPQEVAQGILEALNLSALPHVEAGTPVLLTLWKEASQRQQIHLVNYSYKNQTVTLHLPELTAADLYTPGSEADPNRIVGSSLRFSLESAKVLRTLEMAAE